MDILILGNGFDLAHDLKTSYKDFLEYCTHANLQEDLKTNLWLKHFITRQNELGDTWIDLENEIYNVIKNLIKLPILRKNNYFSKDSQKVLPIEKNTFRFSFYEIEKYLRPPHFHETLSKDGVQEFGRSYIINYYIQNYKDLISLLYTQLREFTELFEKYLIEDVLSNIEKSFKYSFSLQTTNKTMHVLNFNYTDTYERFYKIKSIYANTKSEYVYIHGKVNNTKACNLILGTHSFYNFLPNPDNEEIPVEFNVFKKHNQRHKYCTIDTYQDFLKMLTDNRRVIKPVFHIIGHSLDKTDHNILKHVLLANKNAVINVYYHNEAAQEKLINNITKIIGEEEVMTRVRFIYQHDEKRGILIKENNLVAQKI